MISWYSLTVPDVLDEIQSELFINCMNTLHCGQLRQYLSVLLLAHLALYAKTVDYSITRAVFGSPLRLTASHRTAGAVSSLTFRGVEFINSFDHGRELQSALSFDGLGECYNPTEAGSNPDDRGDATSSRLLSAQARGSRLTTVTDMAFWLRPGQPYPQGCGGRHEFTTAQNTTLTGGYQIRKQITLGAAGIPNAIEYAATFTIPNPHRSATYEFATAYMPPEFTAFFTFDPATGKLAPLSDGRDEHAAGEQPLPVILATPDRTSAMGVWSPDPKASYGRFRFLNNPRLPGWNTVKWNCVFRAKDVQPGQWSNRCFIAVGTVDEVVRALSTLAARRP